MLRSIWEMQKTKRFIIQSIILFLVFSGLYFQLDYLNMPYSEMKEEFGIFLVVTNIFLNLTMSFISSMMLNFSTALVKFNGKEGKGTFLSGVALFFGMLTYGCTPCVVAFFSTIGITFFVLALPLAGLLYKFISLGILILGGLWLAYEIQHAKCKVNKFEEN